MRKRATVRAGRWKVCLFLIFFFPPPLPPPPPRRDPASRELHHRVLPSQDPTTGRGPCPARAGGGRVRPPGRLRDVLRRSGGPRPPRPAQKYYPPVPPPCPVPE